MKRMKRVILSIILIIVFFEIPSFARYYESIKKIGGKATIAEPIVRTELLQEKIITNVNKINQIQESYFNLKNYVIENNNKRINETDFLCDIEIKLTDENFPVRFELYDCLTDEELLKGTNKVSRNSNS